MIDLYTAPTPNGWKASIALEELGFDYQVHPVNLLAGEYSIADIANWSWVRIHEWAGVAVDDLPHLRRWMDAMASRPVCQRGVEVPGRVPSELIAEAGRQLITR